MTEQHELLENTASGVDEASGKAAPADQPGFDIPPIEEDRGEPDKTVPVESEVETAPETSGRPETDAAVENPTLTDVFVWCSAFPRRRHKRRRTAEPG